MRSPRPAAQDCTPQLRASPIGPRDPVLWSCGISLSRSPGLRPEAKADPCSHRGFGDGGTECLVQLGRVLMGRDSAGCPASCPRCLDLLFWLRSTASVNPLPPISFLETQPVFPPRVSPCRDIWLSGGWVWFEGSERPCCVPTVGARGPHCGPRSLGIHSSDSEPALGHTGTAGPAPSGPRGHSLLGHGIFGRLLSRSLAPLLS